MREKPSKYIREQIESRKKPSEIMRDAGKEQMTEAGAYARAVPQGLLFSFRDELAGAVKNPLGAAKKFASHVGGNFEGDPDVASYEKERDESRALDDYAMEKFPKSYISGEITGGVLPALFSGGSSAVATGARTASTATKAGKALMAAKKLVPMAAEATLQGMGNSKANNAAGIAAESIGSGITAPAFKLGMDKVAAPIAKKIGNATGVIPWFTNKGSKIREGAARLAERATEATPSEAAEFYGAKTMQPVTGRRLLRMGMIPWFGGAEEIAKRAQAGSELAGKGVQEGLDQIKAAGQSMRSFPLYSKANDVRRNLVKEGVDVDTTQGLMKEAAKNFFVAPYVFDPHLINAKKGYWQKLAGYSNKANNASRNVIEKGMAETLNDAENEMARNVGGQVQDKFLKAKRDFSTLAPVTKAAKRAYQARKQARFKPSGADVTSALLGATLFGGGGALTGDDDLTGIVKNSGAGAALGFGAKRAISKHGAAFASRLTDAIGKKVRDLPQNTASTIGNAAIRTQSPKAFEALLKALEEEKDEEK
jgi:hypothetical protein